MLMHGGKYYRWAALGVMALLAVIAVMSFTDYGITWDEELQSQYGLAIVDYYTSLFQDQRYAQIFNLYLYGGMFDGLASVFDRFTPFSVYQTRHLVNAFFGLLGLWGVWRLGRFMGGGPVGLIALLLCALTPMYYGHMFNNPKDIPFSTGIIWTLYFMGRCFAALPRPKPALLMKLSIVMGLTLGVRVGGAMIMVFWLFALGLEVLVPLRAGINGFAIRTVWARGVYYGWRVVLPVLAVAYVVMLICWPWAQQSPIMNPLRALSEFSNFPQDVEVLLNGTTYRSTQLPWYYVPLYFSVQLPEMLLVLLGSALILMQWIWRRFAGPQRQTFIVMMLMTFVPIMYAMLRHPALYDAVRHFLFVVPLACVLAALAAWLIFQGAQHPFHRVWARWAVAAGVILAFVLMAATQIDIMVRLHPYEYIYANLFTGGVKGAYGKYELDYWGTSFKEAAEKIQAYVAQEGGVPPGKIYRIAICGPWDAAMIYLPPDYEAVVANEPAEFFLSTTRWMCQNMRPGTEIIKIKRMGAPLGIVKDLRGGFEVLPGAKKLP